MLLAGLACSGDNLLLPGSGQPSRIEIVSGNGQTGTVGQALASPLVVLVTDPEHRPVPGVEVAFIAPAGAQLAPDDRRLTGSDGKATVQYTLATVSGDQSIEARVQPVAHSALIITTFNQTAQPESATDLVVAGGDRQTAEVRTVLKDSLSVRAVDRFNNGVAGIEVTWRATDGAVSPATVVTGADGRAATQRTLGSRTGVYRATAAADLRGSPLTFEATGIAPPSPQLVLVTQPSSSASAGIPFDRQPVLQLQDAIGAPLLRAGVSVTVQIATGGGSLGGSTAAASDAQGRVSFTDLSIRGGVGNRTLLFAASDFTPATSDPIAVGAGPPAIGRSSAQVPNGVAGGSTTISVRLGDEFGTPVVGAAGSITISIAGANPVAALAVTDLGNGGYSASYVPTRTGTDLVDVRVSGAPLGGSPFPSVVIAGAASPSTTTASVTKGGIFLYQITVLVAARDGQGNPLGRGGDRVQVQVDGGGFRDAEDRGDGTYQLVVDTFNFTPTVVVTLNTVPISGSPFRP